MPGSSPSSHSRPRGLAHDTFLDIPRRTLIISMVLHLCLPFFFYSADLMDLSPLKILKKKNYEEKLYQSFVQVDMVALPEKVGIENKFVDPSLPIVKNPQVKAVEEAQAKAEETRMRLAKERKEKAERARAEKKRKAAAERKRKKEAERKKKEALEKKKQEQEEARKKALADLKRRIEQEKAIKQLNNGSEGRAAIAGNIKSEGTSTQGKSGGKGLSRYMGLVSAAVKKNFNVFSWLKDRDISSDVHIQLAKDGKIRSRAITRSSGNERFDSAVLQAVDDTRELPLPEDPELLNEVLQDGIVINFDP